MFVLLATDGLLFLLIVFGLGVILYVRRYPYLMVPWQKVGRNSVAMSALVILSFYLLIGCMDSIHFYPKIANHSQAEQQYSTKMLSVLDLTLSHLRKKDETTYSAPFATHSYLKETVTLEDGNLLRRAARLQYGGVHLGNVETEKTYDILYKSCIATIYGIIIWLMIFNSLLYMSKLRSGMTWIAMLRSTLRKDSYTPWRAIGITLFIGIITVTIALYLSNYYHIFGTDKVGQDVLYQALKSVRTGLIIGTLSTLIMLPFAIIMGLIAGYFGGLADDLIQYVYTTLNSIPSVLLIVATILILQIYIANHAADFPSIEHQADLRLLFLCVILGMTSWTGLCRLLRGETLKLKEIAYVRAAKSLGSSHYSIILRHLFPNVAHIVMIVIVLDFSGLVLAEVVLSYINIGVDPSMQSWGNMINSARLEIARDPIIWWTLMAAFIFMCVLVLAANLFADVVRDAFDPRQEETR